MTREVKADLDKLNAFIAGYNLTDLVANPQFKAQLQDIHRRYNSLLTFSAEIVHQHSLKNVSEYALSGDFFDYVLECISDIGNAVFCWVHGAYKPARFMMRSCIENFVRGVGCLENSSFLTEKNLYKLFELANNAVIFQQPVINKGYFDCLHGYYKVLCSDVHTAGKKHMVHLHALRHFPNFSSKSAKATESIIADIIDYVLSFFCVSFKDTFHKMHHRNQENILNSLNVKVKNCLHGIQ